MSNPVASQASPISPFNPRPYFRRQGHWQGEYSGFLVFLFNLMAAYTAMPIIDIPLVGLSLSAPLFTLVALQALLRPPEPWLKRFQGWIILAGFIWLGVFVSVVGNGLRSGGEKIDSEGWLNVIRFAYWLLVFVVTAHFASRGHVLPGVCAVLGWAAFGLALARLFEAAAWDKIGAWTNTRFLTQNDYGFLFSIFFPFLLAPVVRARGGARLFMIARLIVAGAAVIINGSRGSWVGVAVGIFVFALLFVLANPRKMGWSALILALSAGLLLAVQFAPDQVVATFDQRLATFQKLEEEKSYLIRELMVQKGLKLFQESPLIGVGASRFRKESTPLEIPYLLSYAEQEYFDKKSAHNSYVALLAETGLAGSAPFAVLILILALRGLKASLALARRGRAWAPGVYAAFAGMSIHMWGISTLTNTANWLLYGLMAAMIAIASRPRE